MLSMEFDNQINDCTRILQAESRPGSPGVSRSTIQVSGGHGSRVGRMSYRERIITVPILIPFDNMANLQRRKEELARWLIHREAKELTFSDEPNATYYAHYTSGLDAFEEFPSCATTTLKFTCYDPFKYGREITTGLNFNNTRGGESSPCIITVRFRGDAAGYNIRHEQQDKEMRINWNFNNGDVLEIDTARRKVMINERVRMTAFDFRTQMVDVIPGINTLTTNVAAAWTEIRYRPRWI